MWELRADNEDSHSYLSGENSRMHSIEFSWGSSAKLSSRCLQPQPARLLTCLLSSPSLIPSSKFPFLLPQGHFSKETTQTHAQIRFCGGRKSKAKENFQMMMNSCSWVSVLLSSIEKIFWGTCHHSKAWLLLGISVPGSKLLCFPSTSSLQETMSRHDEGGDRKGTLILLPLLSASVSSGPFLRH